MDRNHNKSEEDNRICTECVDKKGFKVVSENPSV